MAAQRKYLKNGAQGSVAKGFSLLELLIVVAVILIIAAIAIPNFIRSKMAANESSAVQNLRNMTTAEVVYSTTYGISFSATLVALAGNGVTVDLNNAGLIDPVLGSGTKTGFTYTYTILTQDAQGHVTGYSLNADPQTATTGTRHFYTDHTGVIRWNTSATASATDAPIQ